jgi:hypothetical protein
MPNVARQGLAVEDRINMVLDLRALASQWGRKALNKITCK